MPEQQATTPAPMPIEQTNMAQKIMVAVTSFVYHLPSTLRVFSVLQLCVEAGAAV